MDPRENDWRVGFCLLLYRSLNGTLTPPMTALHTWMVARHPDHFNLARDPDDEIEVHYREALEVLKERGRENELVLLRGLLRAAETGVLPTNAGCALGETLAALTLASADSPD
jgi:hypothetical protein